MIVNMLCVGIGGFIGSVLRYLLSVSGKQILGFIPFGTLLVNILGGFLIGLIMEVNNTYTLNTSLRLFLTTGLMGGLTTFSTFSLETVNLLSQRHYLMGTTNILLNVLLSLLGVFLGKLLIKCITTS